MGVDSRVSNSRILGFIAPPANAVEGADDLSGLAELSLHGVLDGQVPAFTRGAQALMPNAFRAPSYITEYAADGSDSAIAAAD